MESAVGSVAAEVWRATFVGEAAAEFGFPPNVLLFDAGSPSKEVYFLESGLVKLYRLEVVGSITHLSLLGAYEILGSDAAILRTRHQTCARTLVQCTLRRMSAESFRDALRNCEAFSWAVHCLRASESRECLDAFGDLTGLCAADRLKSLLARFSVGDHDREERRLRLPLALGELANTLAVTPEYLYRFLRPLEQQGFVHRFRGSLYIEEARRI